MFPPEPTHAPFDAVAADYDAVFTRTPLGRRQRAIVHRYLEGIVRPGMRVLELNCGTGEDAVWLAKHGAHVTATDQSEGMLQIAAKKVDGAGMSDRVTLERLPLESLAADTSPVPTGGFDLILSNFDGINCLEDVSHLPETLARFLAPNGHVVLVFMNPVCAMEIAAGIARGRFRKAFQRLGRRGLAAHIGDGNTVHTWFHPVHRLCAGFRKNFTLHRIEAVGLITPPTLLRDFFSRHQRLFRRFYVLEDLLSPLPPFNRLGDHVMIHAQAQQ